MKCYPALTMKSDHLEMPTLTTGVVVFRGLLYGHEEYRKQGQCRFQRRPFSCRVRESEAQL